MHIAYFLSALLIPAQTETVLPRVNPVPMTETMQPESTVRTLSDFRNAVRDSLQKSSRNAGIDPEQSVPELAELYRQLGTSAHIPAAERKRLQGMLRTRLLQIEGVLVRRLIRAKVKKADASADPTVAASPTAAQPESISIPRPVLAQQLGIGQTAGGAAAGMGPRDTGWDLVELIRATVAPETWEVNGGKGSMYYYRPLQVLVIRQTQEVHHQIGGAIRQLR